MKQRAFTLVELLVTITIISILAAIALFALAGVESSAKRDKTLATIAKLNSLIMAKYESYRTRRLPIQTFTEEPYSDTNNDKQWESGEPYTDLNLNGQHDKYPLIQQPTQGPSVAKYKVDAMRDFMRMEMPERFSDIDDAPVTKTIIGGIYYVAQPSSKVAYQAAIPPLASRNANDEISESAKCLYLIITKGLDDPDAIGLFNDDEIAIDPADNLKYFVDGWGNQILFFRWAPGFASPLQADPSLAATHDPFDAMGVYKSGTSPSDSYRFYDSKFPTGNKPPLYPLIYSSGGASLVGNISPTEIEARPGIHYASKNNDPYFTLDEPPAVGSWKDTNGDGSDGRQQDITNHDLSQ